VRKLPGTQALNHGFGFEGLIQQFASISHINWALITASTLNKAIKTNKVFTF